MKRIVVGSINPVKILAVQECLKNYDVDVKHLRGVDVDSNVADQPQSLEETFSGAANRARAAFATGACLSIGIEDGIFLQPGAADTFMNICVCALYDGTAFHYGTSSCFEYPSDISDLVRKDGLDVSQALGAAGYTNNAEIGSAQGAIGILSGGRLVRKDYAKQAVNAALIHLDKMLEPTL